MSGALEMIGSLGAGALNYAGAREANRVNKKIAREQMQFQERMSNTAYQRSMEDMRKAGLNPILAYNQGGASTPPGASAQMQNELGGAVSSAVDAKRMQAEIKNAEQDWHNKRKTGHLLDYQLDTELAQKRYLEAMRILTLNTAKGVEYDNAGKKVESLIDDSPLGVIYRLANRTGDSANRFMPRNKLEGIPSRRNR